MKFTSKKADVDQVAEVYRQAYELRLPHVTNLHYASLGWTDEDVRTLAAVIRSPERPLTHLKNLNLHSNLIGDEGVRELIEALDVGAPALETLVLTKNAITNQGLHTIAGAIRSGALPQLKDMSIKGVGSAEEKEIVQRAFREQAEAAGLAVKPHDLNLNDHYKHIRHTNMS